MKIKICALMIAMLVLSCKINLAMSCPPSTYSVQVYWDRCQENDVAGYRIYFGKESRKYDSVIDVGNHNSHQVEGLQKGTIYYFAVTAYDTAGNESDFSEEVSSFVAAESPSTPDSNQIVLKDVYNFPNPFQLNGEITHVRYFLTDEAKVSISIMDLNGGLVKKLIDQAEKPAGEHVEEYWDGKNESGAFVSSGVYFCKVSAGNQVKIIRMAVHR